MTKRRVRARRVRPQPEPEPEPEPIEDDDYSQWKIAELRAELKERDLPTDGRKAQLIERLLADDAGEYEEDEPEPEPVEEKPAPKKVVRKRAPKAAVKRAPEPEPEEDEEPEAVTGTVADLLAAMEPGQALTVTRLDDDDWQFSLGGVVGVAVQEQKGRGLRGADYWSEVCTPEYYTFYYEDAGGGKAWEKMTAEEREEFAEDLDLEWEEHDDERITKMNMFKAITAELGLVKYKDEYKSPKARRALR